MIRVGFLLSFTPNAWLGGANYFRSLLGAVKALPDPRIQPIVFVGRKEVEAWRAMLPGSQVVPTRLADPWSPSWLLRKGLGLLLPGDPLLARLFRAHGVDLYSHGGSLGKEARVRSLCWVPDFQHRHLPGFFSKAECRRRDRAFQEVCRDCHGVIVSSHDAQQDLLAFYPGAVGKVHALRFVPEVPSAGSLPGLQELEARYGFQGPFFHLPNQFWQHKNHAVVVEALADLKSRGITAQVLATGSGRDPRNSKYYDSIEKLVHARGLEVAFRILGVVPYKDMLGLMYNSIAVVNPSLFEGWSTTVEEAKRFGIRALLSDIPVHREQAPPEGLYFDPRDPTALADAMAAALSLPLKSAEVTDELFQAFGWDYQSIALGLMEAGADKS